MLNPYQKKLILQKRKVSHFPSESVKPVRPILEIFEKLGNSDERVKRINRGVLVCCPFHGESHASCALYEDTNSFFCFTCKEAGDYITFTMKLANVGFTEALSIIDRL